MRSVVHSVWYRSNGRRGRGGGEEEGVGGDTSGGGRRGDWGDLGCIGGLGELVEAIGGDEGVLTDIENALQ